MKQKYGAIEGSKGIRFYDAETFDEVMSISVDDAFMRINSHDKLVKALEDMVDWYAKRDEAAELLRKAHQPVEIRKAMEAIAAAKGA